MVVDSKVFKVNTMTKKTHLVDKYTSILDDPAKKKGIQLTLKQLKVLKEKSINTTRAVQASPISQLSIEPYKMNEYAPKPLKPLFPDLATTSPKHDSQFTVYTRENITNLLATSKKPKIVPLTLNERQGSKW